MSPQSVLALTGKQHKLIKSHLFPGDGLEAAAILLCASAPGPRTKLVVREFILIPHAACQRREHDRLTWPGAYVEQAIECGEAEALSIVLLHSHPGGFYGFSAADDTSDQVMVRALHEAYEASHGSAVMVPDGAIRARTYDHTLKPQPVDLVTCAGDDLLFWWGDHPSDHSPLARPVAFTGQMTNELSRLHAIIIGVSGTGSIQAEQAARLGFGRVTLIDFDKVELKNLNRILNSTLDDANRGVLKVDMFAEAIRQYRGEGVAMPKTTSIATRDGVVSASQGDVLFSCVDTLEARQIADLISAAFLIPLFDVGVVIPVRTADTGIAVADVVGRIDYIQPGGSTLRDRGVYSPESLRAEYLKQAAPDAHQQELNAGYIKGAIEQAPAVITLNMRASAACMSEFIARAYPFRHEANDRYARTLFSLATCEEEYSAETDFTLGDNPHLARGGKAPLLGLPMLEDPSNDI
jgi:hypothetical protein